MKKKAISNPKKYETEWRAFNKRLRSTHFEPITLEAYIDYLHGKPLKTKVKPSTPKLPSYKIPKELDHSVYKSSSDFSGIHPTRNSIMDPISLLREDEETRNAIIEKSKRIAIAYNKGSYQYITDGTDPKTIGRKTA